LKDEGLSSEEEFNHKKKTFHFATAPGTEKPLAGTAAAQGQQPPKDQADKVWLGCLGIIVLLLLIVWIVGQASSGPTTTQYSGQESSPTLSSKAQWREKIRPYWNPGGPINVTTIVNFKALVGEPSQTQSIEGHAFWYYNCSDGTIQVELVAPSMSGGRMLIHGVNDY